MKGTALYFDLRTLTQKELDTCRHVHLTLNAEWDPQNVTFPCSHSAGGMRPHSISSFNKIADISILKDIPEKPMITSTEPSTDVSTAKLSERWQTGIKQAKDILCVTAQRGLRSTLLPLSRRYKSDFMFLSN